MKSFLNYLAEASTSRGNDKVVITFGRFNPLTGGHEKLANAVAVEAAKRNAIGMLFTSATNDSKNNPLKFDSKVEMMTKAFPNVHVSTDKSLKSVFQVATKLASEGVKELTLVVGGDRVEEFQTAFTRYVGDENSPLQLNFNKFEVVSAGERTDNNDVSGMSASKMRNMVVTGDINNFINSLPTKLANDGNKIFELVKKGMNI